MQPNRANGVPQGERWRSEKQKAPLGTGLSLFRVWERHPGVSNGLSLSDSLLDQSPKPIAASAPQATQQDREQPIGVPNADAEPEAGRVLGGDLWRKSYSVDATLWLRPQRYW
jgi:hypothetical protein